MCIYVCIYIYIYILPFVRLMPTSSDTVTAPSNLGLNDIKANHRYNYLRFQLGYLESYFLGPLNPKPYTQNLKP